MPAPQNDKVREVLRGLNPNAQDTLYDWIVGTTQATVAAMSTEPTESEAAGVTTDTNAAILRNVIKVTVAKEAFTAEDTTESVVIATVPAKTRVVSVIASIEEAFELGEDALTVAVGPGEDVDGYIEEADAAVEGVLGLAAEDLGSKLAAATAVQGGHIEDWADASDISVTLVGDGDDLGDGEATSLTAGSLSVWIVTETFA